MRKEVVGLIAGIIIFIVLLLIYSGDNLNRSTVEISQAKDKIVKTTAEFVEKKIKDKFVEKKIKDISIAEREKELVIKSKLYEQIREDKLIFFLCNPYWIKKISKKDCELQRAKLAQEKLTEEAELSILLETKDRELLKKRIIRQFKQADSKFTNEMEKANYIKNLCIHWSLLYEGDQHFSIKAVPDEDLKYYFRNYNKISKELVSLRCGGGRDNKSYSIKSFREVLTQHEYWNDKYYPSTVEEKKELEKILHDSRKRFIYEMNYCKVDLKTNTIKDNAEVLPEFKNICIELKKDNYESAQ